MKKKNKRLIIKNNYLYFIIKIPKIQSNSPIKYKATLVVNLMRFLPFFKERSISIDIF